MELAKLLYSVAVSVLHNKHTRNCSLNEALGAFAPPLLAMAEPLLVHCSIPTGLCELTERCWDRSLSLRPSVVSMLSGQVKYIRLLSGVRRATYLCQASGVGPLSGVRLLSGVRRASGPCKESGHGQVSDLC